MSKNLREPPQSGRLLGQGSVLRQCESSSLTSAVTATVWPVVLPLTLPAQPIQPHWAFAKSPGPTLFVGDYLDAVIHLSAGTGPRPGVFF